MIDYLRNFLLYVLGVNVDFLDFQGDDEDACAFIDGELMYSMEDVEFNDGKLWFFRVRDAVTNEVYEWRQQDFEVDNEE
jgi:hypothetical protein